MGVVPNAERLSWVGQAGLFGRKRKLPGRAEALSLERQKHSRLARSSEPGLSAWQSFKRGTVSPKSSPARDEGST